MQIIRGVKASNGISIGKVVYKNSSLNEIYDVKVPNPITEYERFEEARRCAILEVDKLYEKAVKTFGKETSLVVSFHKHILHDEMLIDDIKSLILKDSYNAEYAVHTASCKTVAVFNQIEDEYLRERANDVKDVAEQLISILKGTDRTSYSYNLTSPVILAAEDFFVSDTVNLDKSQILGFISQFGGRTSHAAILARTINKPAVVGITCSLEYLNDKVCIIDGDNGQVIVDPDEATIKKYTALQQAQINRFLDLKKYIGVKSRTKNGKVFPINANIGSVSDISYVLENDCDGIGLFRSEFLYIEGECFPSEELQFEAYKKVLVEMKDKPVTVRTFDLGSDKTTKYLPDLGEKNPALGYRAIRISLEMTEVFITQVRALMRASVYGNLSIMFPMIVNENELDCALKLVAIVKKQLLAEKIPFNNNVKLGVMIETPAAAMIADKLAKLADFFSIGTNDLTQYTIAVDRTNAKVSYLYNSSDLAVLRLIKRVVDEGHKAGIKTSICGESAADPSLLPLILAMEVDSISVIPSAVLEMRSKVIDIDVNKIRKRTLDRLK